MSIQALRGAGLIALGFVGGVLGLSAYTGTPLSDVLVGGQSLAAGDICASDSKTAEEEIFFLSCGGIF